MPDRSARRVPLSCRHGIKAQLRAAIAFKCSMSSFACALASPHHAHGLVRFSEIAYREIDLFRLSKNTDEREEAFRGCIHEKDDVWVCIVLL